MLIPSDECDDGRTALDRLIVPGSAVRAAVAFVTDAGVSQLAEWLEGKDGVTVELVARAADVTDPDALLRARDQLGCDVSVVIGKNAKAFHPKLWLIETDGTLSVLAGSGNLTSAGMTTNDEQFDVIQVDSESDAALAQIDRFERLTRNALSLDQIEGSTMWIAWRTAFRQVARLHRQLADAQRTLNGLTPMTDRSADKRVLVDDLQRIYDDTVAARLPRKDGGIYVPSRLLQAIRRAQEGDNDPVRVVTQTCRNRTGGFDVLLQANRPELTLENLVLDEERPYHDLFYERTRELSRERLAMFPKA